MGRGPYSLYPRHVRASICFAKKRLSTHTMHFKWHHRHLSKNDQESLETNHDWRHAWSFSIFKYQNLCLKYQNFYLATQMEHDQSSYFCRGPDDFCWGPAPVGPTLVTEPFHVRPTCKHYGRRAFSVAGQSAWNSLSVQLRDPDVSIGSFRR